MRAVVVDDEPLAREGVELMLRELDVTVVASCASGSEAIRAIRQMAPDVVFLDIKMPGLSGFDVVESVGADAMPAVVFLTAYEEHAVRAFRANAADYLLKPIDAAALAQSVDRVRRMHTGALAGGSARRLEDLVRALAFERSGDIAMRAGGGRIALKEGRRITFVEPGSIVRASACGDYVTVHTADREIQIRDSITAMESRLGGHGFSRIHRSHIVGLSRIRTLELTDKGRYRVVLDDGATLPVGRTYRQALIEALACAPEDV